MSHLGNVCETAPRLIHHVRRHMHAEHLLRRITAHLTHFMDMQMPAVAHLARHQRTGVDGLTLREEVWVFAARCKGSD